LLVLLVLWVIGQILGWSLVVGAAFRPLAVTGWIDGLYYSGRLFVVGDVLPGTGATRLAPPKPRGRLARWGS
jgi:hypothetical protein